MSPEDKKEIAQLLREATPWSRINLSGVLQALIIAGVIGIWTRLEELAQTDVARNQKIEVIQRDIQELKESARVPRFTKDEFNLSMKPIQQTLDNILEEQRKFEERLNLQRTILDTHIKGGKE